MIQNINVQNINVQNIIIDIKRIMSIARKNVAKEINIKLLHAYWEIGRAIVENEQNGNVSPEYGKKLYTQLFKELTKEFGKGFSRSNLFNKGSRMCT